jgi:hypothetical protein
VNSALLPPATRACDCAPSHQRRANHHRSRANRAPAAAEPTKPSYVTAFVTASCMGVVFGFLFEKSHVYEPQAIRGQFNFEVWIMMKMFMVRTILLTYIRTVSIILGIKNDYYCEFV